MRRIAWALLAALAVPPAAHAAPPGFYEAQAVFDGALNMPTRLALQTWLIAGGYTNAVPVEHLSVRTFEAIERFQIQNGFDPTGQFTRPQVDRLSALIRPDLSTWGLRKITFPGRTAYTWVPLGLGLESKSNASGLHFTDPRNRLWFDFVSAPDRPVEEIWREMLAQEARQSADVHFKVMKEGWFVISATTPDGHDHYYRYHQDGADVTGFALEWNNAVEDVHAERIATLASGALKASMDGGDYVNPPFAEPVAAQIAPPVQPAPPPPPPQPQLAARETPPAPAPEPAPPKEVATSGTAVFVADDGTLVTSAHLVADCAKVTVKTDDGQVREAARTATDQSNDLAILKLDVAPGKAPRRVAVLRVGARLGEAVEAFGFPHPDLPSGYFALGNISAMTGAKDDSRYLQMSVPVQAGNSGGPLLDGAGNLVGVVSAKADAVKLASAAGDLPAGGNLAVKSAVVATFLDANGVSYKTGSLPPGGKTMDPADIAEAARAMSGFVACR